MAGKACTAACASSARSSKAAGQELGSQLRGWQHVPRLPNARCPALFTRSRHSQYDLGSAIKDGWSFTNSAKVDKFIFPKIPIFSFTTTVKWTSSGETQKSDTSTWSQKVRWRTRGTRGGMHGMHGRSAVEVALNMVGPKWRGPRDSQPWSRPGGELVAQRPCACVACLLVVDARAVCASRLVWHNASRSPRRRQSSASTSITARRLSPRPWCTSRCVQALRMCSAVAPPWQALKRTCCCAWASCRQHVCIGHWRAQLAAMPKPPNYSKLTACISPLVLHPTAFRSGTSRLPCKRRAWYCTRASPPQQHARRLS